MTTDVLRSAQAGAILTALGLSLSVGLMSGVAEAKPKPPEPACLSPIFQQSDENPNWQNLNLRYGVKDRIIGPPAIGQTPACRTAYDGEKWVRAVPPWIMADEIKAKEFRDNFVSVRYVIYDDPDSEPVEDVTVGKDKVLQQGLIPTDLDETTPNGTPQYPGLPWAAPVSPAFGPLPVCPLTPEGTPIACHRSTVFIKMLAPVCNGLLPPGTEAPGLIDGRDCLPAGESEYPIADNGPFTVVALPAA
jgi:hypothetical protein